MVELPSRIVLGRPNLSPDHMVERAPITQRISKAQAQTGVIDV